jgi:hypothetical protein
LATCSATSTRTSAAIAFPSRIRAVIVVLQRLVGFG